MTYCELDNILSGLMKSDRMVFVKMETIRAIKVNISLNDYDEEGFEEVCKRIFDFWEAHGFEGDVFEFCYEIEQILDNDVETEVLFINQKVMEKAWRNAMKQ